ncbi:trimethylamine methyltransferase family protein [Candidatus Aerophobetes bacterium]|nr:trimethylamine methyltransferase family protein [Candidatus Aerophobetes bacterium]
MFESCVKILSEKDLNLIHSASLKVLRRTGVKVENDRLVSMLRKVGCKVEGKDIVKIPEEVIEDVLQWVKSYKKKKSDSKFIQEALYSRGIEAEDDPHKVHFCASGQSIYAHDLKTDKIRPATKKDLIDATRLVASLPDVGLSHPVFIPQDVPQETRDIHTLEVVSLYYPDSRCVELFNLDSLDYFVQIGLVLRDSMDELRKNPCFSYVLFTDTPLRFSKKNLEIAFKLYDIGLSSSIGGVMVIPGANTPVTLAGSLIVQNAEILASNLINKVLNAKPRGYSCVIPTAMDMRYGISSQGAPEVSLLSLASIQLMNYYGFPVEGLGLFNTDSKLPDVQAGIEKTFGLILGVIAGVRSFTSVGVLAGAQVASLAQIVIDAEIAEAINRLIKGINCDSDELAVDLIQKVGIGRDFLSEEHTVKKFREELWFPELTDRTAPSRWLEKKETLLEKAKKKVAAILKERPDEPIIDEYKAKEIRKIVKEAEKKLV